MTLLVCDTCGKIINEEESNKINIHSHCHAHDRFFVVCNSCVEYYIDVLDAEHEKAKKETDELKGAYNDKH